MDVTGQYVVRRADGAPLDSLAAEILVLRVDDSAPARHAAREYAIHVRFDDKPTAVRIIRLIERLTPSDGDERKEQDRARFLVENR